MAWVETTNNPLEKAITLSEIWDPINSIDNTGLLEAIDAIATSSDFYHSEICSYNKRIALIDYGSTKQNFKNLLDQEPAKLYNGEWYYDGGDITI